MAFSGYRHGDAGFRRVAVALFAGSLASYGLLYCIQPLLPEFARVFDLTPAQSTLSISLCTVGLGVALLVAGALSDAVGRVRVMRWSLALASLFTLACAFAPSWPAMLVLRALTGVALAGFPGVAMAYLRAEVVPGSHARATGLYVGANGLGGLMGRLVTGGLTEIGDWRLALGGTAAVTFGCTLLVVWLLPASRNFTPADRGWRVSLRGYRRVLRDPVLIGLYLISFVAMGSFVAMFNIAGFRLESAPYLLPVGLAGLIYLTYPIGSIASTVAGRYVERFGRSTAAVPAFLIAVAGIALTAAAPLWVFVVGVTVVVIGFFAVHSIASGWVAQHAYTSGLPTGSAASAYLFAYYLGGSVCGTIAGSAWRTAGWAGVAWMDAGLICLGLLVAVLLRRRGGRPRAVA